MVIRPTWHNLGNLAFKEELFRMLTFQTLIWLPGLFLCVGSCIASHRLSCDARKACLYAAFIFTHPQLLVSGFDSLSNKSSRSDFAAFVYRIDGCGDLGRLERDLATFKLWESGLRPLGRNWMRNFEPCGVASGMQRLDSMLIHLISLYISLSLLSLWWGSPVGYKLPDMCHWVISFGWKNLVHKQPTKDRATSTRLRKQAQNWWPRCSQAYDQFFEGVADRNWGTLFSWYQLG